MSYTSGTSSSQHNQRVLNRLTAGLGDMRLSSETTLNLRFVAADTSICNDENQEDNDVFMFLENDGGRLLLD